MEVTGKVQRRGAIQERRCARSFGRVERRGSLALPREMGVSNDAPIKSAVEVTVAKPKRYNQISKGQ